MAVNGVEKVVKFDDAVVVVGKGYWPAIKGLGALSPNFSDGRSWTDFPLHPCLRRRTVRARREKLKMKRAKAM